MEAGKRRQVKDSEWSREEGEKEKKEKKDEEENLPAGGKKARKNGRPRVGDELGLLSFCFIYRSPRDAQISRQVRGPRNKIARKELNHPCVKSLCVCVVCVVM